MIRFRQGLVSALVCSIITLVPVYKAVAGDGTSLPSYSDLTAALDAVSADSVNNGAIFSPARMWAAVVDRTGKVVAVTKTTGSDPWPGSRVIAMQKANTANAFSNTGLALSTANTYSAVQPGGSLFGLQHSNPVNTDVAYKGPAVNYGTKNDPAAKEIDPIGGVNVFGGGLPLYHQETGEVLGALGVSGDSSCADHVIAWRVRHALGFTKVPGGVNTESYGGATPPALGDDNIIYDIAEDANGHSKSASGFGQPTCGFGEGTVDDLPSMENF
jgi:uncharacterized protein GlcG (DUF336 family)